MKQASSMPTSIGSSLLSGRDASFAAHPAHGTDATTPDGSPIIHDLTQEEKDRQIEAAWATREHRPRPDGPGGRMIIGY